MTKRFLLCLILLAFTLHLSAQFTEIAKGPAFEEPEKGISKVLLLKDGSTFYFNLLKSSLKVKIYDPNYKTVPLKPLSLGLGSLKGTEVVGCFEINGNVVLFISEFEEREPILNRVVINPKTCEVVSSGKIASLKRITLGDAYASIFGNVPMGDFMVSKDPYSDNYAIAYFNSFVSERDQRVEIVHYDKNHKEISRSFMSSPQDKFKYILIRNLVVLGDQQVIALLYAYNTRSSGGKEDDVLIASFSNNNQSVNYKVVDIQDGFSLGRGLLRYNPVTKKVLMVSTYEFSKRVRKELDIEPGDMEYALQLHEIDPITLNVVKGTAMNGNDINKKYKDLFGERKNYSGLLQNFFINDDGGYSIILEGYYEEIQVYNGGRSTNTIQHLTDLAVINLDKKGFIRNGALLPKHFVVNTSAGNGVSSFHASRDWSGIDLGGGNQFKLFAYLSGKNKNYVLFNDVQENADRIIKKGKVTAIRGLGECDAFSFETNSGEILPNRKYLFGAPDKKEHNMALFAIADYDRERNIFATLRLEEEGRDKKVRLVWLKPE